MTAAAQVFFICLISGLLLVGAEIFVPGGVLGTVGAVALVAATAMGFIAFPSYGPYIMVGIVVLVGLVIVAWIRIFPKSKIGRIMAVERNLHDAKATEDGLEGLIGATGEALSDLRPAGFARIAGKRVDVVTQGGMIHKGAALVVAEVEGNRVVVRAAPASSTEPSSDNNESQNTKA